MEIEQPPELLKYKPVCTILGNGVSAVPTSEESSEAKC